MEGTTRAPKPNEFVLPEREAYAMTDINLWAAAEFIMTKLEPVQLEDVDPDDLTCVICQEEYRILDDKKPFHAPVKTPCGHVFGKSCIIKWLNPLFYWDLDGPETRVERTKTSCPTCRRVFYNETRRHPLDLIAARLWYWDLAYAFVGIARSEKEERSRKFLWQYVKYCRSIKEFTVNRDYAMALIRCAEDLLSSFALRLESQALTPVQEGLRKGLVTFGHGYLREKIVQKENNAEHPIIWVRGAFCEVEEYEEEQGGEVEDKEDEEGDKQPK